MIAECCYQRLIEVSIGYSSVGEHGLFEQRANFRPASRGAVNRNQNGRRTPGIQRK